MINNKTEAIYLNISISTETFEAQNFLVKLENFYLYHSLQDLEHKLKEADEMHTLLQLECEKYKSVLAETVGNDF